MAVRRGGAGTPARRGSAAPERGEIYLEYSLLSGQMRERGCDARFAGAAFPTEDDKLFHPLTIAGRLAASV